VPRPRLSFGGSSPAAYRVGGAEADIYCLWGEPLASTAEQIESVKAAARAAGRDDVPKIQVAFRPIIAPTEEKAWEKAHDIVRTIEDRGAANSGALSRRRGRQARPGGGVVKFIGLTRHQFLASLELFQAEVAPALRRSIPDPQWPGPVAEVRRRPAGFPG
jgi:alkanesulfonate monooxygenase